MRERPIIFSGPMVKAILEGRKTMTRRPLKPQPDESKVNIKNIPPGFLRCPYGIPGDRMWVRETWAPCDCGATDCTGVIFKDHLGARKVTKWRPSIHLLRIHSRLTLEITNVRVEKLQEIVEQDAEKEGVFSVFEYGMPKHEAVNCFHSFWNSIYGQDAWDKNPWVWVIEFRVVK